MNTALYACRCKDLRSVARQALAGRWKPAIIATVIWYLLVGLPAAVVGDIGKGTVLEFLCLIWSIVASGAVAYGFALYQVKLFRNRGESNNDLFEGFHCVGKTMALYFLMLIFVILWTCLFVIPGIVAIYRYSMAYYVMIDHPEYSALQCINASKQMTMGNKGKIFKLDLTFLGWAILASLVTGIITGIFGITDTMNTLKLIAELPVCAVIIYRAISHVVCYEILNGRFQPGVVEGTVVNEEPAATVE